MASEAGSALFQHLRVYSVENPKAAREQFLGDFDSSSEIWNDFLELASRPGEGRLRQFVAAALNGHPKLDLAKPTLLRWLDSETDEFARRATAMSLSDAPIAKGMRAKKQVPTLADVYSYVAGRMKHDVRNGLYEPRTRLLRLRRLATDLSNESERNAFLTELAGLDDGMRTVGRLLEFREDDEQHFEMTSKSLKAWLEAHHERYCKTYRSIEVTISGDSKVYANDYHLDRIFWNVWRNAHTAAGEQCHISVCIRLENMEVLVQVTDNGPGFTEEQFQMMFKVNVAKDPSRGRGLLEIQDSAVELKGQVEGVQIKDGTFRIQVRLPLLK